MMAKAPILVRFLDDLLDSSKDQWQVGGGIKVRHIVVVGDWTFRLRGRIVIRFQGSL